MLARTLQFVQKRALLHREKQLLHLWEPPSSLNERKTVCLGYYEWFKSQLYRSVTQIKKKKIVQMSVKQVYFYSTKCHMERGSGGFEGRTIIYKSGMGNFWCLEEFTSSSTETLLNKPAKLCTITRKPQTGLGWIWTRLDVQDWSCPFLACHSHTNYLTNINHYIVIFIPLLSKCCVYIQNIAN